MALPELQRKAITARPAPIDMSASVEGSGTAITVTRLPLVNSSVVKVRPRAMNDRTQ